MDRIPLVLIILIAIIVITIFFIYNQNKLKVAVISRNSNDGILGNIDNGIFTNIDNGINYYLTEHPEYVKNVKFYYSDGTSGDAMKQIKLAISNGARTIVGPYTTDELEGTVENYMLEHPLLKLYTGSCTSPSLRYINNITYFIPFNTIIASAIARMINSLEFTRILVLYRNDPWGTDYNNYITSALETELRDKDVISFPYDYTMPPGYLTQPITDMKIILSQYPDNTCVVFAGFDECTDYISLVKSDPDFIVPHYGTDAQAYVSVYLTNPYINFMIDTNFQAVSYMGENTSSTLRRTYATKLYNKYGSFTGHTLIYYDIMEYIFGNYQSIENFYGISGTYSMVNNRRQFGICENIRISETNKYWYPFSSFNADSELTSNARNRNTTEPIPGGVPITYLNMNIYIKNIHYSTRIYKLQHTFPGGSNIQTFVVNDINNPINVNYPIGTTEVIFYFQCYPLGYDDTTTVKFKYSVVVDNTGKIWFANSNNTSKVYTDTNYWIIQDAYVKDREFYVSHDGTTKDIQMEGINTMKYGDAIIFNGEDGRYVGVGYEGINNLQISPNTPRICMLRMILRPMDNDLAGKNICMGDSVYINNYDTNEPYRYQMNTPSISDTFVPIPSGLSLVLTYINDGITWYFSSSGISRDYYRLTIYRFNTLTLNSQAISCASFDNTSIPKYGDSLAILMYNRRKNNNAVDSAWLYRNGKINADWNYYSGSMMFKPAGGNHKIIGDEIRCGEEFEVYFRDAQNKFTILSEFGISKIYDNYDGVSTDGWKLVGNYPYQYLDGSSKNPAVISRSWLYWFYSGNRGFITGQDGDRTMVIYRTQDLFNNGWIRQRDPATL